MSQDGEGPSTEDAGTDAPEAEGGSGAPETRLMIVDASDLDSVPLAGDRPDEDAASDKEAADDNDVKNEAENGAPTNGAEDNGTDEESAAAEGKSAEGTVAGDTDESARPTEDKTTGGDTGAKADDESDKTPEQPATTNDDEPAPASGEVAEKASEKDSGDTASSEKPDSDKADSGDTSSDKADGDKSADDKTADDETSDGSDSAEKRAAEDTGDKNDAADKDSAENEKTENEAESDKPEGDTTESDKADGDTAKGDKAEGDTAKGDEDEKDDSEKVDSTKQEPTVDPSPTGTVPVVKPASSGSGRSGPGRGVRIALGVAATLVVAYLLLAAAWAFDLARHNDAAMRGLFFADQPVGGMVRSEMAEVVDGLTGELADQPLTISVGEVDVETDPVSVGVRIDDGRMIDQALRARRTGSLFLRPFRWVGHLFSEEVIDPIYIVDAEAATEASEQVIRSALAQPVEPEFQVRASELVVIPGEEGVQIEPRELVGRLPVTISEGAPFRLELAEEPAIPELATADLEELAAEVNEQTEQPITVQVLDDQVQVSPRMMKTWVRLDQGDAAESDDTESDDAGSDADDDETEADTDGEETDGDTDGDDAPALDWRLDEEAVLADLKPLFPTLGSEDQQARFSVVDDEPIIIPASETVICCDDGAGDLMERAMRQPIPVPEDDEDEEAADDDEVTLRVARLSPIITDFDEGVAELEALGIVELVSTFETKHACCQNRVKNIQRFADLMQGVIIRPDETFSLNEHVGQRTREKGFFADGAIAQGVIEPQVGGGISQYATTFFNASFFAGIEFVEYQSHSIYISRYPRGREATISWRRPDLEVRNNTPYGILVWNEYTPTSIKVSFYSTEHLDVQALDLRRSSDRQCRIDITPRVITYPDGTQIEDSVFALYRPGEGFDCNGNSTRPEEDEE